MEKLTEGNKTKLSKPLGELLKTKEHMVTVSAITVECKVLNITSKLSMPGIPMVPKFYCKSKTGDYLLDKMRHNHSRCKIM